MTGGSAENRTGSRDGFWMRRTSGDMCSNKNKEGVRHNMVVDETAREKRRGDLLK